MFFPILITTLASAITGGTAAVPVKLDRLDALADRRFGKKVLKVGAITIRGTLNETTTASGQDGVVPGKRFAELIDVQYTPKGWGMGYASNASCRTMRRMAIWEGGHALNFVIDAADAADSDGTNSPDVMYPLALFLRNGYRKKDTCPHVKAANGDMLITVGSGSWIDGWASVSLSAGARIEAWCTWGDDDEFPVYSQIREQDVTNLLPQFQIPVEGNRLRRAALMVDGSQGSSTTHLAGSFDETVTLELDVPPAGKLTDKARCDELVSRLNATLTDAAAAESLTVPEVFPILTPEPGQKATQVPTGRPSVILSTSTVRDTATGTGTNVILVTDELKDHREGVKGASEYKQAIGRPLARHVHRVTGSKKPLSDAAKSGALPVKAEG